MTENRISGYLYNELFSESNKEKYTAFQGMAWSLIVDKNIIKNCSIALQAFSFRFLSLYPLFPLKARILLQFFSQAFSILFSPFSFVFKFFFTETCVYAYFNLHDTRELQFSLWSKIISMRLKIINSHW